MSVYVLVHGSWHGAFCWDRVVPLLQRAGHTVKVPDLPGHGDDRTPLAQVTLKSYVDRVSAILDDAEEPVILVGHSMAGMVISQVGEERPDKIASLVYLTAFLPQNGQSLMDLAGTDQASRVTEAFVPSADGVAVTVRASAVRAAFYGDCSDEVAAAAEARLKPEPLAPLGTPVTLTEARYGRIPRFYIQCHQDQAVTPGLQRAMLEVAPCRILPLSTSHSPFYSAPEALAAHLLAIGKG